MAVALWAATKTVDIQGWLATCEHSLSL
jgi:hypothetical protein